MKEGMKLQDACEIAERIKRDLESYCDRVEIAGSIRRGKQIVKDIEIVALPIFDQWEDLFGNPVARSRFDDFSFSRLGRITKGGDKYKKIMLPEEINLDLFIVTPPAQWGVIFLIRTGPAKFSHWMVTQRKKGGALPSYAKIKDGCILNSGIPMITPDEIDFFDFCTLDYIDPKERRPLW